jgi:putative transposase
MSYNPEVHHRRTIRLNGYDYSQEGAYFVTLVTHGRQCFLSEIENGQPKSSLFGRCAEAMLESLPIHFPVAINHKVVMPNHIHILLSIVGKEDQKNMLENLNSSLPGTQKQSLGAIVQTYKSITTRRIHALQRECQTPVWQRNYYEHIVRDQDDFDRIADYIQNNPINWENDELN